MNVFKIALSFVLFCLLGSTAQASFEGNAKIVYYTPQMEGQVFFTTNGQRSNVPACATASGRWVIDSTTPSGQALIAGMLTAYALGKTLSISGTGTCSVWGDTETAEYYTVY